MDDIDIMDVLTGILRTYQAMILEDLCTRYGLDRRVIFQKYHTPSFYQPFVVQDNKDIVFIKKAYKKSEV